MAELDPAFGGELPGARNWVIRALELGGMPHGIVARAIHRPRLPRPNEQALASSETVMPAVASAGDLAVAETLVYYGPRPDQLGRHI